MTDPVLVELKRRLAQADQVDMSRHQFVNMERVRDAAGDLWPTLRERVFVATRTIIERKVAEDDLIIPCATGFLVVFSGLSGDPAAKLTEKIRREMERFFLGDADLAELSVESSSERLSVEEFRAALAAADADGGTAAAVEAHRPRAQSAPDAIALAGLSFEAAWDAHREAVASFLVRPRTVAEREGGWSPDLDAQLKRADERLKFDLAVLSAVAGQLETLLAKGSRCGLITPAGFASLSQPRTRSAYVTALSELPAEHRQLIWVCIYGAPADAPAATLAETGRIVRAHSPHLFIKAQLGAPTFERYAQAGPGWIGAQLPARLTSAARADIESFVAKARRHKAKVFFSGCHDWEAARGASRRGADLIIGRTSGICDEPTAPFRLSRNKLLARAA
jgi:hypothetical protein